MQTENGQSIPGGEFARRPEPTKASHGSTVERTSEHPSASTALLKRPVARGETRRGAAALGWLSIGLGMAEVFAPDFVARSAGIGKGKAARKALIAFGIREIAAGVGILARRHSSVPVWSRVAGDMMDLAFLGQSFQHRKADKTRLAVATAAVAGITLLDAWTATQLARSSASSSANESLFGKTLPAAKASRGVHVTKTITVNRTPDEVFRFWRNFENFPRFMAHLESVTVDGPRSHWRAKAPAGMTASWDAEIISEREGELIAWRSLEGADIPNSGTVRFKAAPGDRGTEIHVELHYDPPGKRLGALVAKLFGEEPSQQIDGDLRRFKQVMETGEVMNSDASIHRGMHPAQPSKDSERVNVIDWNGSPKQVEGRGGNES